MASLRLIKRKDGDGMDVLILILAAAIFNSLVGLTGVVTFAIQNDRVMKFASFVLVAFAAGALLGGGFFHLLPESLELLDVVLVMELALAGFIVFLVLEVALHWHSCEECEIHPFSLLMLVGDAFHNVMDGIIIAASFLTSIPLGIATTIAIIMHEVPQELGVFGVQVYGGIKKEMALRNSFLAQLTCVIGAVAAYFFMSTAEILSYYILPFAAGGFVYIAASDLIPELHKENNRKKLLGFAVFFIGLLFMYLMRTMR